MRAVGLTGLGGLAAVLAGWMLAFAVQAGSALDWLNRAAQSAKEQNYSGVYVYHHGEHIEVMRVLHRTDARGGQKKVEAIDGAPLRFLRVNNDVYCHLSDGKHVRIERNATRRFFPSLLPNDPQTLLAHYEAKLGGTERVAGRLCQIVILNPRDGYRHKHELWLDKRTGLPLKSRTVNENGGVVSMFVFSEVQIGKAPDARHFVNDIEGKRILHASLGQSVDAAWSVKAPPGYSRVQAAVRPLTGKSTPVSHLIFSDGLSVLSIFIEPTGPKTRAVSGLSAEGAISIHVRNVGAYTVTTLGDVPTAALIETGNSVSKR